MPTDATPPRSTRLFRAAALLLVVAPVASGFFHSLPRALQQRHHHHARPSKTSSFPATAAVTLGATAAGVVGGVAAGAQSEGACVINWVGILFNRVRRRRLIIKHHTCGTDHKHNNKTTSTGGNGDLDEAEEGRPGWLEELTKARETKLLRLPYELRRLEWAPEDDAALDEMIVAGKAEEARAYFEECKATSVPVYRQTLRYHWTQTGMLWFTSSF